MKLHVVYVRDVMRAVYLQMWHVARLLCTLLVVCKNGCTLRLQKLWLAICSTFINKF